MRTNADITVFNKFIDITSTPPVESYWSRQIEGVAWENRKGSNKIATGGNVSIEQATIYIPVVDNDIDYLDFREWSQESVKSKFWTLGIGDIIVRGKVPDEIGAGFSVSDLKRKYADVLTITTVDLMDNGSRSLHHWKVGAG